jgi:hypothetical protein
MQGPVHLLTGIIIYRLLSWRNYAMAGLVLTCIICLFLHGLFDKLAIITYQPPHADFTDPFWLTYHIISWLASIAIIYVFWRDYKWGIIFSLLPEVDWIFIGAQDILHTSIPFYKRPWIHDALNYIFDNTVPFNYLNYLPDNRLNPWACIWELLIIACLALILRALLLYRKNIHFR